MQMIGSFIVAVAVFVPGFLAAGAYGYRLQPPDGTPAALIEGERLEWSELVPSLVEAAGGVILEEAVLERQLDAACRRLGLTIDAAAVEAEQDRLVRTLAATAGLPDMEGVAVLERVKASRGLGPSRFPALLRRNAMLRTLVRDGRLEGAPPLPTISDEDVRQAFALKFGPRVRVRLIVVPTMEAADEVLRRVRPESGPGEPFGEVAAGRSVDPSATRGGLLDPFSLDDANYPVALRRAIARLSPGEISEPVPVTAAEGESENAARRQPRFAIARLEELVPSPADAPTLEEAAPALREEVQMVRERAAMDRLARRLIETARVTIFDRGLDRSWQQQTGRP